MRSKLNGGRFVAVFAMLAATLIASKLSERRVPESLARPLSAIPEQVAGWQSHSDNPPLSEGVLAQLKPTSYLSRTYRKDGNELGLFIAYYAQQRAGESIHSPKHCLPGAGWQIWDYGSVDLPVKTGGVTINKYFIQSAGQRAVVLYWYQSKRRVIANEYAGKLLMIYDTLFTGRTAASIVRITCPDSPGVIADAEQFAAQIIPHLQTAFAD